MKKILILSALIIALIISCTSETKMLNKLIQNGEFSKAINSIDHILQNKDELSITEIIALEKKRSDMQSVKREYTLSYSEVFKKLKAKIPDLTDYDISKWEKDYSLEYYIIDKEKKYYDNCIFDLFLLNKEASMRANIPEDKGSDISKYPLETINAFEKDSVFSKEINIAVRYFQDLKEIPNQSILKAWIPYIRENKFQSKIRIVSSSINNIIIPKKDNLTSMIYFEHVVDKNQSSGDEWTKYFTKPFYSWIKPLKKPPFVDDSTFVFQFIYQYESKGYYKKVTPDDIEPYQIEDSNYQKYTNETEDNLFTPYLEKLSEKIVGNETNAYLKAKKIYEWICENIIWSDPKSVLGDYAEYAAKYKRGDCSAKSNLFISLCRINKIPARNQGGWLIRPEGQHAQHSWAQVYFKPYGWLPVDVTLGSHLINHNDERVKYFYFGNCTPYHMVIYDDETEFIPPKVFDCMYGGGSQLGAFEWEGGDMEPYIRMDSFVKNK